MHEPTLSPEVLLPVPSAVALMLGVLSAAGTVRRRCGRRKQIMFPRFVMSLSPRACSCMHGLPNARGDEPFASARRAVLVIGSATFGGPDTATVSSTAPCPGSSCVPAPAAPVPQPRIARRALAEPFACQACLETQMHLTPYLPPPRIPHAFPQARRPARHHLVASQRRLQVPEPFAGPGAAHFPRRSQFFAAAQTLQHVRR